MSRSVVTFLVFGAVCSALIYGVVISSMHEAPLYSAHDTENNEVMTRYWTEEIEKFGGVTAYHSFKDAYRSSSVEDKHALAHLFGGVLYAKEGEAAFRVCDTDFSGGCLHEFFGRAIQELGTTVIRNLFVQCEGDIDCTHGIGHGLASFFGYGADDLEPALAVCKSFSDLDPLGCISGVFMEYNMHTILFTSPRLGGDDPYEPCLAVAVEYRPGCFITLPQWWDIEFLKDAGLTQEEKVSRMVMLCSADIARPNRENCMRGVYIQIASMFSFDPEHIGVACRTVGNIEEQYQCVWQSVKLITFDTIDSPHADNLCEYAPSSREEACKERLSLFREDIMQDQE